MTIRTGPRRRTFAIVVLVVVAAIGAVGSSIAFLAGAFAGDSCDHTPTPWVCTSALAAWLLLLLPALGTAAACALALAGLTVTSDRTSRILSATAVAVWLGSGLGWAAIAATL